MNPVVSTQKSEKQFEKLSHIAQAPVLEKLEAQKGQTAFPEVCKKQWLDLAHSDVKTFAKSFEAGTLALNPDCQAFESEVGYVSEVYETCKKTAKPDLDQKRKCVVWLKLYRGYIIDRLTIQESDYSKLPMNILINKYLGRMSVFGETESTELRKMAEEIKHREPENPSVYKLALSVEALPGEVDVRHGAEEAEAGLKLAPDDSELQDAWFYFKSKDPNFHFDEFIEKNPNPLGEYYQIANIWRGGDSKNAATKLKSLIAKFPENIKFKKTLEKLENGDEEQIFMPHIDISGDNW